MGDGDGQRMSRVVGSPGEDRPVLFKKRPSLRDITNAVASEHRGTGGLPDRRANGQRHRERRGDQGRGSEAGCRVVGAGSGVGRDHVPGLPRIGPDEPE